MLRKIRYPIRFQGSLKKKNYFEGWYYKQVSRDGMEVISFIPGISLFDNDLHSFVQYIFVSLDENNNKITKTGYLRYPLEAFKVTNNPFSVQVGENSFSETMISVKLLDAKVDIQGTLELGDFTHIKKSVLMPNIMGFFAYIPKMECYHGVISMNHSISGTLKINDREIDFNKGNGYIEKDWGTSFPKEYIWIQCNKFKNKTISIFASIANIPFMKMAFRGFICNLTIDGKEYRFATYNRSKLKIEKVTNRNVILSLENSEAIVNIEAILNKPGKLIAPHKGRMQKVIKEELCGEVKIHLYDKQNKSVYNDIGSMAGIEIVGF